MEKLKISEELQRKHLINLEKTPGWKVLKYRIEEQIELKRTRLETADEYENIYWIQGEIRALKYILRQIDEAIKGSKNNA